MIGKLAFVTILVSFCVAEDNSTTPLAQYRQFQDVDPNTLSCDPEGHIFLLLPHFSHCDRFFMCVHGEEVEFSCAPGGIIFDFELQTCNWPSATKCILREPKEEGSGDETADGLIGAFSDELENQAVDMVASVRPISPLLTRFSGIINCMRADAAARLVPYRSDCQRYWRCVGGVPQVAYCSDGLFFNDATQQCDYEANVKCTAIPEDELQGEFILSN